MSTSDPKNDTAGTVAKAAVVTAAVAYLLKRVRVDSGEAPRLPVHGEDAPFRSSLPVLLESAPDMLLPLVDQAVEAAGKWVAQNSPELVRDRLLPRFIGAFTDAAKRRG